MKINPKKITIIILIILVVLVAGIFSLPSDKKQKQSKCSLPELPSGVERKVIRVIDGDTFLIKGGHSVRILGIDSDERGKRCYKEAKEALEELILDKKVRLFKGKTNTDKWCRYLRFVSFNQEDISTKMIKKGLAEVYTSKDYPRKDKFLNFQNQVKEAKVGCEWQEETKETSLEWEKITPTSLIKVVPSSKAKNFLGEKAIVEGKIKDTYYHKESGTTFLNFGGVYPNHDFTAVIFESNKDNFKKDISNFYLEKTVRVKGILKFYKKKPEIILKNPSQIEVGK